MIVCAAILIPGSGRVILGVRHYDSLMHSTIEAIYGEESDEFVYDSNPVQGFIDNKGRFHNRKDSFRIALEAGQVSCRPGMKLEECFLYSEDLY